MQLRSSSIFDKDVKKLKKENAKLAAKLWDLLLSIQASSYTGLGKPEALKGNLQGWWSRRIDEKHRLIYKIENEEDEEQEKIIVLASCYGHYGDK